MPALRTERRWIVRARFASGRWFGIEVSRDKGEMRRKLRRLRAGTPRAWGWLYSLDREPSPKRSGA